MCEKRENERRGRGAREIQVIARDVIELVDFFLFFIFGFLVGQYITGLSSFGLSDLDLL